MQINQEIVQKYDMQLYQQAEAQDLLLLKLWFRLHETGDINRIFLPSSRRLAEFMARFQTPAVCAFTCGSNRQIDFIVWFTPFQMAESAAIASLWSDPTVRGTRKLIEVITTVYQASFNIWQHILGVTRISLIAQHQKMGYNIVGTIPGFYEGEAGINVHLTKEAFESSKVYRAAQRLWRA